MIQRMRDFYRRYGDSLTALRESRARRTIRRLFEERGFPIHEFTDEELAAGLSAFFHAAAKAGLSVKQITLPPTSPPKGKE